MLKILFSILLLSTSYLNASQPRAISLDIAQRCVQSRDNLIHLRDKQTHPVCALELSIAALYIESTLIEIHDERGLDGKYSLKMALQHLINTQACNCINRCGIDMEHKRIAKIINEL